MKNNLLRRLYRRFDKINQNSINKSGDFIKKNKVPFLFLSGIFDRDIFTFDSKDVEINNFLIKINYKRFFKYKNKSFLFFYLKIFNISIKKIITWIKRFSFSLVDSIFLIIYLLFFSLKKNSLRKSCSIKKNHLSIYSICYLKNKEEFSDTYYYKGIRKNINNKCLVSCFYPFRSIFIGLLRMKGKSHYIKQKDFIDIPLFINIISNLFCLFIFDLKKFYVARLSIKLKIIDHWSRLNYILFTLLNYQIITKISKYYKKIDLINWGENQIQNKSFIISYLSNKYKNKDNISLATFFGFPFSRIYYPHYVPTDFEIKYGLWGDSIILQDKNSINDMRLHLNEINSNIKLKKAEPLFIRYENDNLIPKDQCNFTKERNITVFTHATISEFIICIEELLLNLEKINIYTNSNKPLIIFIRKHPAISNSNIHNYFQRKKKLKLFKNIKYKIIDSTEEQIHESIMKSSFCLFGESGYINMALKLNSNVISVNTSYKYNSPIQENSKSHSKCLIFL